MNYNILNEKWIESLPEEVEKLFREISLDITAVICQRIKAVGRLSKTDIIRLTNAYQYYGADIKKISEIISGVTGKSEKAVLSILKKAAEESDSFAEVFYSARNIKPLSYLSDNYLSSALYSIAEQTNNQFKDLSKSTLYYKAENNKLLPVNEMYTRAIDKAIYEVRNGTVDYNTAMRKTVRQLGGGLYIYESGKKTRLDSAVRMNLLDSVRQLNQKTLDYHGKQFGSDGVELSAHAISAPDHAPVQGHQFRNEEFEKMQSGYMSIDVNGVVYDGFERPIGQWNCKHFAFPIVVGVSSPAYTEEELANMRENSKQKYDLTQQQRKYELQLRKLKDEKSAQEQAGFDLDARETGLKIRKLHKEYKAFSEKNGLRYSPERARVPKAEKNTQISLTTQSDMLYNEFREKVHKQIREEYSLTVNEGLQNKHIVGTNNYDPTRSTLTADPKELIALYAGKSNPIMPKSRIWNERERFTHTSEIGIWRDLYTGESLPTNNGQFHYSKKRGIHIVPTKPKGRN